MRILVCGGRDLDPALVWNWLKANAAEECADALDRAQHVLISDVIQGGATGADSGAADWARQRDPEFVDHVLEEITIGEEPWPDVHCFGLTAGRLANPSDGAGALAHPGSRDASALES
ncbi:SLOG family protein [Methylobacterium phyllosphaerae]